MILLPTKFQIRLSQLHNPNLIHDTQSHKHKRVEWVGTIYMIGLALLRVHKMKWLMQRYSMLAMEVIYINLIVIILDL